MKRVFVFGGITLLLFVGVQIFLSEHKTDSKLSSLKTVSQLATTTFTGRIAFVQTEGSGNAVYVMMLRVESYRKLLIV